MAKDHHGQIDTTPPLGYSSKRWPPVTPTKNPSDFMNAAYGLLSMAKSMGIDLKITARGDGFDLSISNPVDNEPQGLSTKM